MLALELHGVEDLLGLTQQEHLDDATLHLGRRDVCRHQRVLLWPLES